MNSSSEPLYLDPTELVRRFDDDWELLLDIAEIFTQQSERYLVKIEQALQTGDASSLEHAAHSLKGSCATFQNGEASAAALRLEQMGRSGVLDGAPRAFEALRLEVERLRAAVEIVIQAGEP
jgi:HPt (histidine-containing phosphotransfer) domain-containing protein